MKIDFYKTKISLFCEDRTKNKANKKQYKSQNPNSIKKRKERKASK